MAHPGGRPTKYTPELLEKSWKYLDTYQDLDEVIPSHSGLFIFIGISETCGYGWGNDEDKAEFKDILDICMTKQHLTLVNKGLDTTFNSNICKLVLGKHGYSDKADTKSVSTVNVNMRDVSEMTDVELEDELKD